MKRIINFIKSLKFIFMPHYWIMLGKYDSAWDAKLNELAKEHKFKSEAVKHSDCICYASLGGVHMWVGSYPYSFFAKVTIKSIFTISDVERVVFYEYQDNYTQSRPSRLTIHKLTKKLLADLNMKDVNLKIEK
jgi:hypothetical protein